MFKTLANAWKIEELRKKIIFTLLVLLIYRLGNAIPVPFIDTAMMAAYFEANLSNTILGFYNTMAGNAFSQASVLALGIQPYINASIIIHIDTDGVCNGYELTITRMISEAVAVPVIASGGGGRVAHLADALRQGKADAVLVASMVHSGQYRCSEIKQQLTAMQVPVRLCCPRQLQ